MKSFFMLCEDTVDLDPRTKAQRDVMAWWLKLGFEDLRILASSPLVGSRLATVNGVMAPAESQRTFVMRLVFYILAP